MKTFNPEKFKLQFKIHLNLKNKILLQTKKISNQRMIKQTKFYKFKSNRKEKGKGKKLKFLKARILNYNKKCQKV